MYVFTHFKRGMFKKGNSCYILIVLLPACLSLTHVAKLVQLGLNLEQFCYMYITSSSSACNSMSALPFCNSPECMWVHNLILIEQSRYTLRDGIVGSSVGNQTEKEQGGKGVASSFPCLSLCSILTIFTFSWVFVCFLVWFVLFFFSFNKLWPPQHCAALVERSCSCKIVNGKREGKDSLFMTLILEHQIEYLLKFKIFFLYSPIFNMR